MIKMKIAKYDLKQENIICIVKLQYFGYTTKLHIKSWMRSMVFLKLNLLISAKVWDSLYTEKFKF